MTKLLEHAIARVRALPDADQDAMAAALLSLAAVRAPVPSIDYETREAISECLRQGKRREAVADEDVTSMWAYARV